VLNCPSAPPPNSFARSTSYLEWESNEVLSNSTLNPQPGKSCQP
jgi:hypothetical protein